MKSILGIDAAWTPHHASGVALIRQSIDGKWESVATEDCYLAFVRRAGCTLTGSDGSVSASDLLEAARCLGCSDITLVVADIPLSRETISGRRCSDNCVSEAFGGRGCSTHTPSTTRPGPVSEQLRDGFEKCGYKLATADSDGLPRKALVETYPHPALLSLMDANYRIPYKIDKARKYYPEITPELRRTKILHKLREIYLVLSAPITGIAIDFPAKSPNRAILKSIEDRIDALVCAWVGIQALAGKALPMGDHESAIWLPSDWCALFSARARASEEYMHGVEDLPVQERAFWTGA